MFRCTPECHEAVGGHWLTGRPESTTRSAPQTIRVFENPLVEATSRAHPATPGIWFGPFVVYVLMRTPPAGWGTWLALFVAGALWFTLFEYGLHRVIFHGLMRLAARDPAWRFTAFMAHGYHHEFPNDPTRLVMPPMISWPLALAFGLAYRALLGPSLWMPLLAGTMTGYLAYDWVHFYTHHARPTTRLGKWMRAYHLRHHYQDPNAFFGISTPLWDLVFGTFRSPLAARPAGGPSATPAAAAGGTPRGG